MRSAVVYPLNSAGAATKPRLAAPGGGQLGLLEVIVLLLLPVSRKVCVGESARPRVVPEKAFRPCLLQAMVGPKDDDSEEWLIP
jgi:hypothetical protein